MAKSLQDRLDLKYHSLKEQVRQVIIKHPKYGIDRIKADLLLKFKVTIGRDSLGKLLYIWALSLPKRQLSSPVSGISKILCYLAGRANLLIRSTITAPPQAISSDGTEIVYNHGNNKMWLVTASFKIAQTTLTHLTGNLIPAAILYHQDRGSVYTGYDYVDTVLSAGGKLSYSDPGTPTQNPGQESFHGRFKSDNADEIFELETDKEVIRFLISRLNDYNQERLHASIHNQPPFEFTKSFLRKQNNQFTGFRD